MRVCNDVMVSVEGGSAEYDCSTFNSTTSRRTVRCTQKLSDYTGGLQPFIQLRVRNEIAYIAVGGGDLRFVGVGNPQQPQTISTFEKRGWAYSVRRAQNGNAQNAFVALGSDGLSVFDVADTNSMIEVAHYTGMSFVNKAIPAGDVLYALGYATNSSVLASIDISNPRSPITLGHGAGSEQKK